MTIWFPPLLVCLHLSFASLAQEPLLQIEQMKVEGASVILPEQIIKISGIKPKSVIKPDTLKQVAERIENAYRKQGYIRAQVSIQPESKQSLSGQRPVADIVIHIIEGAMFTVRRVEFMGNSATRDLPIRRRAKFYENDPFNPESINVAVKNLNKWGHFEKLNKDDVEITIDEQKHYVDILIKLKEKQE